MTSLSKKPLALMISAIAFGQVPVSRGTKPPYLQKAIEKGAKGDVFDRLKANARAQELRLPEPFQTDEKVLIREMESLAKAGDPRAVLFLGNRDYHQPADRVANLRGEGLIKQAANLGYAEAQNKWAGVVLFKHRDAKESRYWRAKAIDKFEARASQGDMEAMYWLGMNHGGLTYQDSEPDVHASHSPEYWLRKAAEKGHIPAAASLWSG